MDDTNRIKFVQLICFLVGFGTLQVAHAGKPPLVQSTGPMTRAVESPELVSIESAEDQPPLSSVTDVKQVSGTADALEATSEQAIEAKQENVATELRIAMLQEENDQETAVEDTRANAEESNVDYLKQIEVTIAQQKSATSTLQDLQAKQADLEVELSKLADGKMESEPPYSILVLDQLNDSLNSSKAKRESLEASILAAREAVERSRLLVDDRKTALRQLKEKLPEDDPKIKAAELDIRLAEETLVLRRQELANEQAGEAIRNVQEDVDRSAIAIVAKHVRFDAETLDEKIAESVAQENELKRRAATLQSEIQYAERRWLSARQDLETASLSAANTSAATQEQVDALKAGQQTSQRELDIVNQRLQRLPLIRTAWEKRFRVVSGDLTREERRTWTEDTKAQLEILKRDRRARELKLDEVRFSLGSLAAKAETGGSDPSVKRWLDVHRQALTKQIEIYNSSILAIGSAARIHDRLLAQLEGERGRTLSDWLADSWASANRFWNYELASDEDISLTVGKIISSVLFLFIGYFAACWISGLIGRRLPKLGVDEAGSHAIESLSFYGLLITFGLAALKYANVPLTVFTFLGGAVAIGIGFGSQNILNNFISGLILLAERPIKVGDLISIDGTFGNVTQIGARSTQIRTGENLDIIVPNSSFLENNVTNLTRRDDRLRTSITVGVAYGSDLRQVIKLLEQAAVSQTAVLDRPKPFVWFNDFGDNALAFQVHFFINARTLTAMKKIETEVRLTIDELFREHNIVIAFPQRDLHIQTPNPIEFRLVGNDPDTDNAMRRAG